LVAVVAIVGGMLLLQPGAAVGSAVRVTNWQPESANCGSDVGHTVIFVPGTGPFTPLFLDTRQTLVPYQVRFNLVGGGGGLKTRHQYTIGETLTKPAPVPAKAVTCEVVGDFTEDGTVYSFTATMTGVLH
jgi:hypothetical protein